MMFRKLLSVAVLTALFSFALGNTDAEARHGRRSCCSNGYGQSVNYGYGNQGYGYGNSGCCQSVNYNQGNQCCGSGNSGYGYGGHGHGGYSHGGYGYGNRRHGGVSYGYSY